MRSVFCTPYTPARGGGRGLRSWALIRALASKGTVDVTFAPFGASEPDPALISLEQVSLHQVAPSRGAARLRTYVRARTTGIPDNLARGISPELVSETERLAEGADLVVADGPIAAGALGSLARRRPVIYSAHNLESRMGRPAGLGGMGARTLERFERRLLESSSESWMVSPADMTGAAGLAPSAKLRLVPNVVDVEAIEPLAPRDGQRVLLFIGDLLYPPNRGALDFLLERGMPELWRRAPDLELLVLGRGGESVPAPDARVTLTGFAPDLRAAYESAGCAVVPLLEGGGSPLKFVEALAHAMPVAATPVAARGLTVVEGEHFVGFDPAPEPFATAVLDALDPAIGGRLAKAGRELAEREYSIAALSRSLPG